MWLLLIIFFFPLARIVLKYNQKYSELWPKIERNCILSHYIFKREILMTKYIPFGYKKSEKKNMEVTDT